jgi:hypothetical protein
VIEELVSHGMPILSETPPAPDVARLVALHHQCANVKIQVAEQYWLQPLHVAIQNVIDSGKLGTVSQAQISVAHGYHGISLMRKFLGVGFANATIQGMEFESPLIAGPNRQGLPPEEKLNRSKQQIATFLFDGKMGVFDFTSDQYFSWIRSARMLIRGEKGEINNHQIRYLEDYLTPVSLELKRIHTGIEVNLEGFYHKGIVAGSEWVYKNPVIPAALSDDEIAIATCLLKMHDYVQGGPSFYSLAEAAQDHYLNLKLQESILKKEPVQTTTQPWATGE